MDILGVNGGNGVILYPFKKYLIANLEIRSIFKTPNNIQWELNFGGIPLYTKKEDLYKIKKCDIIIGAPNCGHSSILAYSRAKKLSNPMEDESFTLFLESIKYLKPKIFLMENLPKLLDFVTKEIWEDTFPEYDLIFHIVPMSYFGNSQKTRVRLVLIGILKKGFGKDITKIQYHFNQLNTNRYLKTCKELLKNLNEEEIPGLCHLREDISETITMYAGCKINLNQAKVFWLNNPLLKRWPVYDKKFSTAPGVYRNLDDNYPAVARKANRQFNSLGLQMSPRELARIQGVPDTFKIYSDDGRKTFSINKGRTTVTKTPPMELSRWFKLKLLKIKYLI